MYNYEKIINLAKDLNCDVLKDEKMSSHTSFKIGGKADLFLIIKDENTLLKILQELNLQDIPFFVIGNGSNLLISDDGIKGVVLKLSGEFNEISLVDHETIKCGAGVLLSKLCNFALKNSLAGLEFAFGIPGSVGGAVYMNAGAYGGEMKDVISSCNHVTKNGENEKAHIDDLNFSYRKSIYTETNDIITSVIIKLKKDDAIHIKERMNDFISRRKTKQPLEYPSAGSVFKRPVNNFAGTLIENCGLKGKSIGGAMISEKHAGFIVNKGGAKCEDVINLIKLIQDKVLQETGVILECEVKSLENKK